jgi:predicted HD phosphohydrolase
VDGADLGYGRAEFAGQLEGVDVAAARLHQVGHVEQDQGGQADGKDRRGQHQLAGEVQGIEDQQDGVGLGRAGHFAAQHVDGDAGVFRVGGEE